MSALLDSGYASARAVTRHHAKSFYFSSLILFGARRRGAFAIYAFCRRLDDLIDEAPVEHAARSLDEVREMVKALFERGEVRALAPWPQAELHALLDTARRFGIGAQPFLELIDGMEMDLTRSRYATWAELDVYCYRVAGVVGLMMAPLLGTTDPTALGHAADLGRAMQLTNILRDVKEDLGRGRIYLPQDELVACGVTEATLREGRMTEGLQRLITGQIARARALYASALEGVPWLSGFGSRRVVRVMAAVYGGILEVIERRKLDVFSSRASVSLGGKLLRLLGVLVTRNRTGLPALRPSPLRGEGDR
ncbi:MAG: phytoene/squalene synthase family protein [Archangium sp.]|nr:phytoene/squalene synthase family protein [Archangium sp.]